MRSQLGLSKSRLAGLTAIGPDRVQGNLIPCVCGS